MGDAKVDRERPVETVWRSVLYVDRINRAAICAHVKSASQRKGTRLYQQIPFQFI
jgi:hypothetical protein